MHAYGRRSAPIVQGLVYDINAPHVFGLTEPKRTYGPVSTLIVQGLVAIINAKDQKLWCLQKPKSLWVTHIMVKTTCWRTVHTTGWAGFVLPISDPSALNFSQFVGFQNFPNLSKIEKVAETCEFDGKEPLFVERTISISIRVLGWEWSDEKFLKGIVGAKRRLRFWIKHQTIELLFTQLARYNRMHERVLKYQKTMLRVCQGEQSNFRIPGIPTISFQ